MKKVFTVLLIAFPIFSTYSYAQGNQQINSGLDVELNENPAKKLSYFVLVDATFANKMRYNGLFDFLGVDLGFKGGRVGGFISLKLNASGDSFSNNRLGLNVGYCVLPELMPYIGIGIITEQYAERYYHSKSIAGEAGALITPRGIPLALKVGIDLFRDNVDSHLTVGVGFYFRGS
ncbi:hypothetical protein [Xanthovirga aplysinae]|uniref:hypothetical protein n=1 Tax=Xanthovirga aplysinae TaxID=2529853 RepID=UPI0012BCD101|nr:hypothetical protein [Xanthovirga aplysinae]MTI30507.1 hypothetical protein [Xanthovirga aplysinae]